MMRRIAVVTPILPVPWDRTRGWPIYQTLRELSAIASVDVFFLHARYPRNRRLRPTGFATEDVPLDYTLPGLRLLSVPYPAVAGVSRPFNAMCGARALAPRLLPTAPDLVLAYWLYPEGASAMHVARQLGVPCVVGARGSDIRVRDAWSRVMTKRLLRRATGVLVVSEELRDQAITAYGTEPSRVDCIVNGCDTALFHLRDRAICREACGIAATARVVLFVGRLVEAKGLAELATAFESIAARDPNAVLVLVGDGVYRDALTLRLARWRAAGRVLMPGALAPQDVAQWMGAADLLALPSYSEGYPNVLVEALASGIPVVATDVGGAREIVDSLSGRLVAARDPAALEAALRTVLDSTWDSRALSARFTRGWNDVAAETLAACERALVRHAGAQRA